MPDNAARNDLPRRGFLQSMMAVPLAVSTVNAQEAPPSRVRLEPFDYSGVRLLPSRFRDQYQATRDFYLALPDDDLVHGFRVQAGLPAPGKHLDGWCRASTEGVFGQWLSGMARMAKAAGDSAMRDKAAKLMTAWAQCFEKTGGVGGHYSFDKTFCGLLDLHLYTGNPDALPLLRRITAVAAKTLHRARQLATPADPQAASGGNSEWYTLSENQYRAFLATGDSVFRDFGDIWRYEAYWSRFQDTSAPAPRRVHAYSHVNSFNGAPLAYAVSGDERYLRMARNAYGFVRNTQMFATGGFGPGERLVGYEGDLGRALEMHADTAEIPCGSWAGFKLSRYMLNYTGDARYGDWIERLVYNGIGAALPMAGNGETFYYADYHTGSGTRSYLWDHWPCCSGTYIQAVADYPNLIYFRDPSGLYINLFVPSEVTWRQSGQPVKLTQETKYPESEEIHWRIDTEIPVSASIRFRVPDWADTATVEVNGAAVSVDIRPSTWAAVSRTWHNGDRIVIRVPMRLRAEAVDKEHPDRVAILYGPVVLVEDLRFNLGLQLPPGRHRPEDLARRLRAESGDPLVFQVVDPPGQAIRSGRFYPYYDSPPAIPYRMYHDFTRNELA
jgi:DUF1680 family protein